jgi:cobaltochelatase CobT
MKNLTLLAQVLCRSIGIEVIPVSDNTFATDGKSIFISDNYSGDAEEEDIIRGAICHEGPGHINNTNFEKTGAWLEGKSDLAAALSNVIEDIRIERLAAMEYPGGRRILGKMISALERRGYFSLPDEGAPLQAGNVLISYLIRVLRAEELRQPMATDKVTELADRLFGADLRRQMLEIAREGSRSEDGVLEASEKILSILGEAAKPPKNPQAKKSPNKQQGKSGESSSPPPGSPGASEEPSQNHAATGKEAAKPTPEQIAQAAKEAIKAKKGDIGPSDVGQMVGDVISNDIGSGKCPPSYGTASREAPPETSPPFLPAPMDRALSIRLQSKMQELLRSRCEDEDDAYVDRGRLASSRIVAGFTGRRDIFTVEGNEGEGINTAVHILVDASGSMEGESEKSALSAIYAMSSALGQFETQGAAFALSAFRRHVIDLKSFDSPWPSRRDSLSRYHSGGGTAYTACANAVIPELAKRKAARKVLFVITDGDTGNPEANKMTSRTAKDFGIEVRVLHIGHGQPDHGWARSNGFEHMAYASPGSELQTAIFDTLAQVM